jgi:hypothetical protein
MILTAASLHSLFWQPARLLGDASINQLVSYQTGLFADEELDLQRDQCTYQHEKLPCLRLIP